MNKVYNSNNPRATQHQWAGLTKDGEILSMVSGEMSCSVHVMTKGSPCTTIMVGTWCANKYCVWITGMHDLSLIYGYKFLKFISLGRTITINKLNIIWFICYRYHLHLALTIFLTKGALYKHCSFSSIVVTFCVNIIQDIGFGWFCDCPFPLYITN